MIEFFVVVHPMDLIMSDVSDVDFASRPTRVTTTAPPPLDFIARIFPFK